MATHPIDFVQVTYNPLDREVESRILPLARDRGIGVIINRPFREGALIRSVERHPLPPWAGEIRASIPATSKVAHLRENMGAGAGQLPDAALRARIVAHIERL